MDQAAVIILGAGPAGLAAAYQLAKNGKKVVVLEKDSQVGGISKTIKFNGCWFDLGGHRFYTSFDEVARLWDEILKEDFLVRPRLSRIYYDNKFFDYPLKPWNALKSLGFFNSCAVMLSYLKSKLFPFMEEENFEQWVSNRFGKKLYGMFFKTYTEKVWGMPCTELSSDWAAQRIGRLSLFEAVKNALFPNGDVKAKSLVSNFKYPKYGPGMMYEKMAEKIEKMGGKIILGAEVTGMKVEDGQVGEVVVQASGGEKNFGASQVISTIPIDGLVKYFAPFLESQVMEKADSLKYRSFISVSVILECPNPFLDNWIYIHSPHIKLGRIQNFKNWSPHMVEDESKTTLGLEYFCTEGDELWRMDDKKLIDFALEEVEKLKLAEKNNFVAGFVARIPKAYPVYGDGYSEKIKTIREHLGKIGNLQTIGRAGMFRYNNMDHSVLAGLWAAGNILGESHNVWEIND